MSTGQIDCAEGVHRRDIPFNPAQIIKRDGKASTAAGLHGRD
ncbi:hypothetical protein OCAR_4640 [Afipia carboxidovorans OM5]|nr:hypothetical protein OCAR_4640 [Afipia carboxidovorans OM5]